LGGTPWLWRHALYLTYSVLYLTYLQKDWKYCFAFSMAAAAENWKGDCQLKGDMLYAPLGLLMVCICGLLIVCLSDGEHKGGRHVLCILKKAVMSWVQCRSCNLS
jgi:hypothetical protein